MGEATTWATRAAYAVAATAALPVAGLAALAAAPFPTARAAWAERFGRAPQLGGAPVWIACASVGEVRAVEPLVRLMAERLPDVPLVMSVMTAAGRRVAASLSPLLAAPPFHPPLDIPGLPQRALARLAPRALITVETEIWPHLMAAAARQGALLAIVNGRLSARSHPRYRLIRPLVAEALGRVSLLAMRSEEDAARARELGAPAERVVVTGDLKVDAAARLARDVPDLPWASAAGLSTPPWVAYASTAAGEEEIVLDAHSRVAQAVPGLRAIIAPRRPDRFDEVASLVSRRGLPLVRRSRLPDGPVPPGGVLLLDTMGELARLYRHAEVVFVGGSLVPHGGQNLLDPAAAGRPVLFGPHVENFREAEALLLSEAGGFRVTPATLHTTLMEFLADDARRASAGAAAAACVRRKEGAALRTLALLEPLLRRPGSGAHR